MNVYCDSDILIYYLDSDGTLCRLAENRFHRLFSENHRIVVSDLTRMECSVRPLRMNDASALRRFMDFFSLPEITVISMTSDVFDRAARIRAKYSGLKTPDALHLSAATHGGCERFLTNDAQFDCFKEIAVEILS